MAGNHCSHCPRTVRDWVLLIVAVAGLATLATFGWIALGRGGRMVVQFVGLSFGVGVGLVIWVVASDAWRDRLESKDTAAPVTAPEPPRNVLPAKQSVRELEAVPDNVVRLDSRRVSGDTRRASSG
jgi:hypothetical protein